MFKTINGLKFSLEVQDSFDLVPEYINEITMRIKEEMTLNLVHLIVDITTFVLKKFNIYRY